MRGPPRHSKNAVRSDSIRAPRRRGFTLIEALLALALLGSLLLIGTTFFSRRRSLERERLDREQAARALSSEWTVLRTSPATDLVPRDAGPFLGPPGFLRTIAGRSPKLTIRATELPSLVRVRLELRCGRRRGTALVEEGFVRLPPEPPPEATPEVAPEPRPVVPLEKSP